jgi:hypothetical protein
MIIQKYFGDTRAISLKLFDGSCSADTNVASSLAGVLTVRGPPAFMTTVDVKLPASRRWCCTLRQALASDDSGQNNIALIPSNDSISTFTGTECEGYHTVFVVHVFHGHPITTEHLPCTVSAGNLATCFMVVKYNAPEKCYSIRKLSESRKKKVSGHVL